MPAIRSPKGKGPDSADTQADKGKHAAKAPARPTKSKVDPCNICGVIVSRQSDVSRHLRIHDPDVENKKLSCTWHGCVFRTLQKSNLETHVRRHLQDRSYSCPNCEFNTCDGASLIRHRRRMHEYVPRTTSVEQKVEKPYYKRVPANVTMQEIKGESSSVAYRFSRFASTEASTPGSSSSRRPISPSESSSWSSDSSSSSPSPSPSPSPSQSKSQSQSQSPSPTSSQSTSPRSSPSPPPPPSRSQRPLFLRFRSFSPANSSGESEVSPSPPSTSTPVTSTTPHRELTPEGSSYPAVLIAIPPPVYYPPEELYDSLLLSQGHYRKLPHSFGQSPSELLERHWALTGSKSLGYEYPTEEIYDRPPSMSVGDGMNYYPPPPPPPPISPYANWERFGDETMGQLNGLDNQSFFGIKQFEHTIDDRQSRYNNFPVEDFDPNSPVDASFFSAYCGCPPGSGLEIGPICDECGLQMFPYDDIVSRLGDDVDRMMLSFDGGMVDAGNQNPNFTAVDSNYYGFDDNHNFGSGSGGGGNGDVSPHASEDAFMFYVQDDRDADGSLDGLEPF